jgi:long-chain acyl-CoA synthetase
MRTKLSSLLLKSIIKHNSKPCINHFNYSHLWNRIQHHSQTLKTVGIQPKDRIVIQTNIKTIDHVAMMIAAWDFKAVVASLSSNPHPSIYPKIKPTLTMDSFGSIHSHENFVQKNVKTDIHDENDPCLILFTSGSTADPKGVVLSHKNIVSNLQMIQNLYNDNISIKDRSFSILPWHHCYGLVCELLYMIKNGAHIVVPKNSQDPIPELKWSRPTLLFTVPKMLERIQKSPWNTKYTSRMLKYYLFGDQLRMMSVGGSNCSPAIIEHFDERFQIPIYQGFGMTETSPMISLNSPNAQKIGSVGKPLNDVKIKIDRDEQILVRSPSLMVGYLDEIDNTNTIKTSLSNAEGWFPTGDKGYMDNEGYLFIKGRIKHEYKLSNGKYVNPSYLESLLLSSPSFDQVLVIPSDNMDYNVCLVYTKLSANQAIKEVDKICQGKIEKYEIPRKVFLLQSPFTVDNGLLSMKLEPKRQEILKVWKNLIF